MSIPSKSGWTWNVYLGTSVIAESGCRKRKPWGNTIAYYPLKWDAKDYSWNWYNWTTTWTTTYGTIWNVWYVNFTGDNYISATPMIPPAWPFTISCFLYYQWTTGAFVFQWSYWTERAWITISIYPLNYLQVWSWGSWDWNSIYRLTNDTRYYVTLTYQNWTFTMYVNWNSVWMNNRVIATATPTDFHLWRYDNRWYGQENIKWRLSEVIIENKIRSEQERLSYYNNTKSNYWY